MYTRCVSVWVFFLVLLIPNHVPASELVRMYPNSEQSFAGMKRLMLLPPRIGMYQITAGRTLEKNEDWVTTAEGNVVQAVQNISTQLNNMTFSLFDEQALNNSTRSVYDETRALYQVVNNAIVVHTYDAHRKWYFSTKVTDFRYSLGPETQALSPNADAFLLIEGFDQRSSGGRKALQAGTMLIGAVLGVVAMPRGGANLLTAALVEAKTGNIVWFYRSLKPYDLREASSASQFVSDFWQELLPFLKQ